MRWSLQTSVKVMDEEHSLFPGTGNALEYDFRKKRNRPHLSLTVVVVVVLLLPLLP